MKNRGSWMQRLTEEMDMAQEPQPGRTILEICGDNRVLIENHRGVLQYGQEEICVRTSFGVVCIRGCGLQMGKMTRELLVIRGRIDCVTLLRGGC